MSLNNCKIGETMETEIWGLIHLRYLAIEYCEMKALPLYIGNLRYLQTLILRCKHKSVRKMSNVLWKLDQLRHLVLGHCSTGWFGDGSLKLGNMRELQTLQCDTSYFRISDIGVLVNSANLKKLGLKFNLGVDEIPSVVLSGLSSLSISAHDDYGGFKNGLKILFSRCPQPPNLTKLTLERCYTEEDPMPILEKLPNLRILRLKWDSFYGRLLVCSSKGFPKLQTLILKSLENLEEWRVDEEAMPNLSKLQISYCRELKMIPEGIKFITTLRHLEIKSMPMEFSDRVDEKKGEDFYIVARAFHQHWILSNDCLMEFVTESNQGGRVHCTNF